jgi:hypothetical protein
MISRVTDIVGFLVVNPTLATALCSVGLDQIFAGHADGELGFSAAGISFSIQVHSLLRYTSIIIQLRVFMIADTATR